MTRSLCLLIRRGKVFYMNNKFFWILVGFILLMQIPIFLMH